MVTRVRMNTYSYLSLDPGENENNSIYIVVKGTPFSNNKSLLNILSCITLRTHFHPYCSFIYNYSLIENNIRMKIKLLHVSAILGHPPATVHLLKLLYCISS
jgi:hypothetical protein